MQELINIFSMFLLTKHCCCGSRKVIACVTLACHESNKNKSSEMSEVMKYSFKRGTKLKKEASQTHREAFLRAKLKHVANELLLNL